jgi:hypothetical protein
MLFVSTNLKNFDDFRQSFFDLNTGKTCLDLSKIPSSKLASESTSIVNHHASCAVFLGYLEPGFMLDGPSQTIMRKLFRKFDVAMLCGFVESIPFSWKNEINTLYTEPI